MNDYRLNFFSKIENKYNIALKKDRCIILRYDARNTTKNKNINLLKEDEGSFAYALKKATEELTKKYNCLAYIASDEINLIILDTKKFLKYFKSNYAQEITASISQELSFLFHKNYKKNFIIFAGRAFSVYRDNINSYLIYRKHTNVSVLTVYYIKRYSKNYINFQNKSFLELDEIASKNIEGYNERTLYQKEGICYLNGNEYPIETILTNDLKLLIINTSIRIDDDI